MSPGLMRDLKQVLLMYFNINVVPVVHLDGRFVCVAMTTILIAMVTRSIHVF